MAYFPTFTPSLAVNIGTKYSTPYISASYTWDSLGYKSDPNTQPYYGYGYLGLSCDYPNSRLRSHRLAPNRLWPVPGHMETGSDCFFFFWVGCSGTGPKGSSHFFDMIPDEIEWFDDQIMTSYGWKMLETGNHDTDVMQIARNSLNGTSSPQPTRPAAKSPGPFTRSRSAGRDAKNQEVMATGAMVGMVGPFPSRCVIKTY